MSFPLYTYNFSSYDGSSNITDVDIRYQNVENGMCTNCCVDIGGGCECLDSVENDVESLGSEGFSWELERYGNDYIAGYNDESVFDAETELIWDMEALAIEKDEGFNVKYMSKPMHRQSNKPSPIITSTHPYVIYNKIDIDGDLTEGDDITMKPISKSILHRQSAINSRCKCGKATGNDCGTCYKCPPPDGCHMHGAHNRETFF